MLLTPKDSALVNFGRSNDKGGFEFRNVRRGNYLLKITYVGYLPYQEEIRPTDDGLVDMKAIKLKPIQKELFEVVIKTAKAPLMIRGDTVEYNATSFKVPPGATVEDLLKRLPGIQVDAEGNIRAQGQEVRKVTVDGKTFFGTDPKLATKNLPAEAISKVQVYNDKSEQSKITGVDDGKKEKTMNLELKDSHKKGGFGKVTAGVGTDSRAQLRGNYNRFDQKQQFSVIGFGNNTNQTGLSWDDYQDFRGSQSFNWQDNGDFGFSNGGFIFFSDDEGDGMSVPINNGRNNRGFSENYAGGVNYNYDTKKTKFSSNYFFNSTELMLDGNSSRQTFLPGGSFTNTEDFSRRTLNGNHRATLRFEKELDSLNTVLVIGNGRFNNGNERNNSLQEFLRSTALDSRTDLVTGNRFDNLNVIGTAIYRHKFRKKGRNFAASVSYNASTNDRTGDQRSDTDFFGPEPPANLALLNFNQNTLTNSLRTELKSSLLYVEPITKKVFWESFYNFSLRNDEVDRDVFDRTDQGMVRNTLLSQYFTNELSYNRLGTSLRYTHNGLNFAAGLAAQQFHQVGEFAPDQSATTFSRVDRRFFSWVPNASFSYDLKQNRYLYTNYSVNVRQPSTRDLQPVIDNSNPRFIREGNPGLLPQLTHNVNAGYSKFDPATFMNLFVNLYYNYNINQVVYNQTVDSLLVTTSRPENIDGGQNVGTYMSFGFPLKKTKASLNLNTQINVGEFPIYINDVLNNTRTNNYNVGLRLDLTPSEKFTFYGNANLGFNNTRYSINSGQNQNIVNHRFGADMNVQFPKAIYLNSNFTYQVFVNRRFGFDQRLPILNLSVYKFLMKDNRAEVRLSAYDIFNRNKGITQSATQNFVSEERVTTLARYFMLSFTYNMRGMKSQMRRNGWW